MNPEAQRIAIAESVGWRFIPEYYHGEDEPPEFTTVTPEGKHLCGYYPDYLNDLNDMHEAEKTLTNLVDQLTYLHKLSPIKSEWTLATATARERAEAYLKTIGKWEVTGE